MPTIQRTLAYLLAMLPGMALAAALFFLLRPWRTRRLAAMGLVSGGRREGAVLLFWLFCGGLAAVTLTPRWVVWSLLDLLRGYGWNQAGYPFFQLGTVNLIPLKTFRFDGYILAGNIIMFVPFGFFSSLVGREHTWRRALLTGGRLTGFIECWQLLVGRALDIDDLLLNTLGVLCGFWLWLGLRRLAPDFIRAFQARPCKE